MFKYIVLFLILLISLSGCSTEKVPLYTSMAEIISIPSTITINENNTVSFNSNGPHIFGIQTVVGNKYLIETMKLDNRMVLQITQNYPDLKLPVEIVLDGG